MFGTHFHGDSTTKRVPRFILWSLLVLATISFAAPISIRDAQATTVRLAWDRNPEPDITGYRVYYGTTSGSYSYDVDVGPATSCAISGLQPKTTYYFAAKAYNTLGDISDYSTEIRYPFPNQPCPGEIVASSSTGDLSGPSVSGEDSSSSSGNGGGSAGGGCFIATAAYGSYMAPEVMALREFRDSRLLTNAPGRAFVRFYYRTSPPVAHFIHDHETLRTITRWALTPVVYGVNYPTRPLSILLAFLLGFLAYARAHMLRARKGVLNSLLANGRTTTHNFACFCEMIWIKIHEEGQPVRRGGMGGYPITRDLKSSPLRSSGGGHRRHAKNTPSRQSSAKDGAQVSYSSRNPLAFSSRSVLLASECTCP